MRKTRSLWTASCSLTGILIGTRPFPPVCTAGSAALNADNFKVRGGHSKCLSVRTESSQDVRWATWGGGLCLTAPERLQRVQNHANEPIRQLYFLSVLIVITTNKDESFFAHISASNSTQALQTRLWRLLHISNSVPLLSHHCLADWQAWCCICGPVWVLEVRKSTSCQTDPTTETLLRRQQVRPRGVTKKKFCNSRGIQKKGTAGFAPSVSENHDLTPIWLFLHLVEQNAGVFSSLYSYNM